VGKVLVVIGLSIAGLGLLVMLGVPLGRLPGDIYYRRGNTTIAFPIMTCLVLSAFLSLLFWILRR
jgi:hypothetical protein